MLECQVSAQDFVAALGVLSDALLMKVCVNTVLKCMYIQQRLLFMYRARGVKSNQ